MSYSNGGHAAELVTSALDRAAAAGKAPLNNGDNSISGGAGAETLSGGNGDDVLDGNGGVDFLDGGRGDDTIIWDPGDASDNVDGGQGFDTMLFNTSSGAEAMTLVADGAGHSILTRSLGSIVMDMDRVEHVVFAPSSGADTVTLGDLSTTDVRQVDVLFGDGADTLNGSGLNGKVALTALGGAGADSLIGSHGADTLAGGDGADALVGGAGSDVFVFTAGETGRDAIADFQAHGASTQGDLLVLSGFSDHSFAQALANHHIVQVGADVAISDASGDIVTLQNVQLASLHANDFLFG